MEGWKSCYGFAALSRLIPDLLLAKVPLQTGVLSLCLSLKD